MFYQPDLERTLRAGLPRYPNVTLTLGHEVGTVTDLGDEVEVTVTDRATGTTTPRRARYVVGTDGARSVTRAAIGTGLFDYGFDQPWLVVDVVLRRPVELPTAAVQYCDPVRPSTFVPQVDPHRRWEFMVMPGDDPEAIARPERVAELLAPWITSDDGEVIRAVVYTFHGLVAEHWRRGHVVLAGDSAHQMPPFLGQGMCAGIRDAANLAWKLTRVVRGESPESLLDTYQSEREPHVRSIIESAIAAGGIIQTADPDVARLRNEQLRAAPEPPETPALPALGPGVHTASGGVPLPQVAGSDARLGPGFSLVVADPAVEPPRLDGIERVEVPELAEWLAARDADAALVRPDRYLVGTARVDSLDTLTGALAAHLYDGSA
jgi:3-(3-hydroxy-phenyl)propionate hydroxylase